MSSISIVGPRPDQQQIIQRRYPGVDFVFVASDRMDRGCSSPLRRGEVIIWTRFVSHKHTQRVAGLGRKARFVGGGMTSLMAEIDRVVAQLGSAGTRKH